MLVSDKLLAEKKQAIKIVKDEIRRCQRAYHGEDSSEVQSDQEEDNEDEEQEEKDSV